MKSKVLKKLNEIYYLIFFYLKDYVFIGLCVLLLVLYNKGIIVHENMGMKEDSLITILQITRFFVAIGTFYWIKEELQGGRYIVFCYLLFLVIGFISYYLFNGIASMFYELRMIDSFLWGAIGFNTATKIFYELYCKGVLSGKFQFLYNIGR